MKSSVEALCKRTAARMRDGRSMFDLSIYETGDPQQVHFSSFVIKASWQFGLSYHLQQAIQWNAAPSPLLMDISSPLHDGDLTFIHLH